MLSRDALCRRVDVKRILHKTDTDDDTWIDALVDAAGTRISDECGRELFRAMRTERYSGDGDQVSLCLKYWPVDAIKSIWDDLDRDFTTVSKLGRSNWTFSSESGILYLDGEVFSEGRNNIQISYLGGFGEFHVRTNLNDTVDFLEGATTLSAVLRPGHYNPVALATEVKTRMDAAGNSVYAVAYGTTSTATTGKFTITSNGAGGACGLLWNSGTNVDTNAAGLLGFFTDQNRTGALTYTSDMEAGEPPGSLRIASSLLAARWFETSKAGRGDLGLKTESMKIQGTISYEREPLPVEVKALIRPYKDFPLR